MPFTNLLSSSKDNQKKFPRVPLRINFLARARDIYVGQEEKPKKGTLFFGIIFLLFILLGVWWGVKTQQAKIRVSQYQTTLEETRSKLKESGELRDLNPVRSRELAKQVKEGIVKLQGLNFQEKEVLVFLKEAEPKLANLLGEYRLEGRLVVDLELARAGFRTDELIVSNDKIFVLDKTQRLVLSFNLEGGGMKVLAGTDIIPQARLLAAWEGQVFVLDGQRVAKLENIGGQVTARSFIIPEGSWGRIAAMAGFAGNLYLVDGGKNQIWRYNLKSERFGPGEEWLAKDTQVSFDNVISMSIDGSIWLLNSDGSIAKFSRGAPQNFHITSMENFLSSPQAIFTTQGLNNLYILDSGNNRVVVVDKSSGSFKAEYLWDKIREANGLVVSEEKEKLLLFIEGKVYEVELRM